MPETPAAGVRVGIAANPVLRQSLTLFCWLTTVVGFVSFVTEARLPTVLYVFVAAIQFVAMYIQASSTRFLTAVYGGTFTLVLLLAAMIEMTPEPHFNAVLTEEVYIPSLINSAYSVLLLTTSLFHALTLTLVPHRRRIVPVSTAFERRVARRVYLTAVVIAPIIMTLSLRGSSITAHAYASEEFNAGAGQLENSGLDALGIFAVVAALVAGARLYGVHHRVFLRTAIYLSVLVIFFRLMRGERAGTLLFFASMVLLYYMHSSHGRWRKNLTVVARGICVFLLFEVWGHVRSTAYIEGLWGGIVVGSQRVYYDFWQSTAFDPLSITLAPAGYWHLLHCIDLHNLGYGLDGETIYALVPQALPSFVANAIGYERPLNAAWRIGDYRIGAGGMFIIAEGYWNFGLPGAALVTVYCVAVCTAFERWFDNLSPLLMPAYYGYLGAFGFSIFYGLQPNVRMLQISIAVALLLHWALRRGRVKKLNTQRLALPGRGFAK